MKASRPNCQQRVDSFDNFNIVTASKVVNSWQKVLFAMYSFCLEGPVIYYIERCHPRRYLKFQLGLRGLLNTQPLPSAVLFRIDMFSSSHAREQLARVGRRYRGRCAMLNVYKYVCTP